jgi:hypothetical protein
VGQPEKTALYRVIQEHLLTFEQQWTDEASGRTLPKFVLDELHGFMSCGILAQGFAHLFCESCGEHHVVAFSCKARAVCPSCLGRRMSAGTANLVDHVLPDVPIRQFVVSQTPLRLISLIKSEAIAKKILIAMQLPTDAPELHPARSPPGGAGGAEDWVN